MSAGRSFGLALLGAVAGAAAGGGLGLLGGFVYTSVAATSGFEGYAGFVVMYWLLAGLLLGLGTGIWAGLRLAARRTGRPD